MAVRWWDLKIRYKNGEVDDYYTRLTGGHGWPSSEESAADVLAEMKREDSETFASLRKNSIVIDSWWIEEVEA